MAYSGQYLITRLTSLVQRDERLLAARRQIIPVVVQAGRDAAETGTKPAAVHGKIGAAGAADDEPLLARRHQQRRRLHRRRGSNCGDRCGDRCRDLRGRDGGRGDECLQAAARQCSGVALQAGDRRRAARRNPRAMHAVVGAAGLADRSRFLALRRAWLAGCGGGGRRRCGRRLHRGRRSRRSGRGRARRCGRGRRGRADRVHRALAAGRERRHVLLQTIQRRGAAGRHRRAMRHVVAAAGRAQRVELRLARLLRKRIACGADDCHGQKAGPHPMRSQISGQHRTPPLPTS